LTVKLEVFNQVKIRDTALPEKSFNTPFPKKINTPKTTLRFIRFVAKISVLNPKLPAEPVTQVNERIG
jgi:hypothetical protein